MLLFPFGFIFDYHAWHPIFGSKIHEFIPSSFHIIFDDFMFKNIGDTIQVNAEEMKSLEKWIEFVEFGWRW